MVDQFSRRSLLKAAGIGSVGLLGACDGITFPGFSQSNAAGNTTPPPPNPTPLNPVQSNSAQGDLPSLNSSFAYEIRRSDEDWRARLTPAEYNILRQGGTEPRHSHRYTQLNEAGLYHCQGCELPIYDAAEKIILDIGWVFFSHALQDSVLLGIDGDRMEAHCRRCGSHLGHILPVNGEILHCINGTALDFQAS